MWTMLSPYNASVAGEIEERCRAFRAGQETLQGLQSFISSRQNLFENDRTGIALATLELDAELEHVIYAEAEDRVSALRAIEEYLARFGVDRA